MLVANVKCLLVYGVPKHVYTHRHIHTFPALPSPMLDPQLSSAVTKGGVTCHEQKSGNFFTNSAIKSQISRELGGEP